MFRVVLVNQLRQAQRTGQPGRAAADDEHIRVHLGMVYASQRLAETLHHASALAFFTSSISAGTTSSRLPITATSAISKIGASGSLFTAITEREPFIPTRC